MKKIVLSTTNAMNRQKTNCEKLSVMVANMLKEVEETFSDTVSAGRTYTSWAEAMRGMENKKIKVQNDRAKCKIFRCMRPADIFNFSLHLFILLCPSVASCEGGRFAFFTTLGSSSVQYPPLYPPPFYRDSKSPRGRIFFSPPQTGRTFPCRTSSRYMAWG